MRRMSFEIEGVHNSTKYPAIADPAKISDIAVMIFAGLMSIT